MACDIACQRDKKLKNLKYALDNSKDPEAHERARIAYFTLKDGQAWLSKEKEKIAKAKIEPIIADYKARYSLPPKEPNYAEEPSNINERLFELEQPNYSWIYDILIGLVSVFIVYQLFGQGKFQKIKAFFLISNK